MKTKFAAAIVLLALSLQANAALVSYETIADTSSFKVQVKDLKDWGEYKSMSTLLSNKLTGEVISDDATVIKCEEAVGNFGDGYQDIVKGTVGEVIYNYACKK
ncbi:MAG: hypothetical protein KAX63_01545 [Pseudomonas sp.]|nr:hypothetical protein [Pseudomonas sp.]